MGASQASHCQLPSSNLIVYYLDINLIFLLIHSTDIPSTYQTYLLQQSKPLKFTPNDLFICYEKTIESIQLSYPDTSDYFLKLEANQLETIGFRGELLDFLPNNVYWFVPMTWFIGQLLTIVHCIQSIITKRRMIVLIQQLTKLSTVNIKQYGKIHRNSNLRSLQEVCYEPKQHIICHQLSIQAYEYNLCCDSHCMNAYQTMRQYFPSDFLINRNERIDLLVEKQFGPQLIERLINKKALWLLVMNKNDLLKVINIFSCFFSLLIVSLFLLLFINFLK